LEIAFSAPTDQKCANRESLSKRGSDEDARSCRDGGTCCRLHEFPD